MKTRFVGKVGTLGKINFYPISLFLSFGLIPKKSFLNINYQVCI